MRLPTSENVIRIRTPTTVTSPKLFKVDSAGFSIDYDEDEEQYIHLSSGMTSSMDYDDSQPLDLKLTPELEDPLKLDEDGDDEDFESVDVSQRMEIVSKYELSPPENGNGSENGERKSKKRRKHRYSCDHLEEFKSADGVTVFGKVYTNLVRNLYDLSSDTSKVGQNMCTYCKKVDPMLNVCLQCVTFACLKEKHSDQHFVETEHPLAASLENGTIYCFKCVSFICDKDLDSICVRNEELYAMKFMLPHVNFSQYRSRSIVKKVKKYIASSSPGLTFRRPQIISHNALWGLRGLINLGQTCFLNAIIQALIHTPMLRDYFLTEKIVCEEKHGANKEKPCVAPLFSNLFQEFYNGERTPMSLHDLLHKMWENATHVSGYDQQDAHELFMAMIQALHDHFNEVKGKSNIIDLLFLGSLESSVTCQVCGRKSIKHDPIWDTSLNLDTDVTGQKTPVLPEKPIELDECFKRYCQKEYLQGSESINCEICSRNQESTKQLKFREVPAVFLIHLKRFKHRGQSEKINNPVIFPEHLDMNPFMADFDDGNNGCSGPVLSPEDVDETGRGEIPRETKTVENHYALYAVVNHQGSYDGGHYYAYIRNARGCWYKCDDANIVPVTLDTVLGSPGYLLFYHRETVFFNMTKAELDDISSSPSTINSPISICSPTYSIASVSSPGVHSPNGNNGGNGNGNYNYNGNGNGNNGNGNNHYNNNNNGNGNNNNSNYPNIGGNHQNNGNNNNNVPVSPQF